MHAPTLKRPTLNRYVGLALVLGLAASVALNVVMLARSDDDTASVSDVPAATAQSTNAMRRFADAKQNQIDAAQAAISPRTMTLNEHNQLMLDQLNTEQEQSHHGSAPAINSRYFDNEFGQVDVMQVPADGNAVFAPISRYIGTASSHVDVLQVQAEQRFAPTTSDRFHFDPAQ